MTKNNLTIYEKAICSCNTCKVLQDLIEGRELDYTITHIAQNTNLSRTAVRKGLQTLIKEKKVYITRKQHYKIVANHKIITIFDELIKERLRVK